MSVKRHRKKAANPDPPHTLSHFRGNRRGENLDRQSRHLQRKEARRQRRRRIRLPFPHPLAVYAFALIFGENCPAARRPSSSGTVR
jgi:hypothetical protein